MEKYILNETPVRTSNNFGINNVEVILDIPKYKQFENFDLYTPYFEDIDIKIDRNTPKVNSNKIGLNRKSNYNIKIVIPENMKILDYPIKLVFNFNDENEFLVENIDIILEKNSYANFEIIWKTEENECSNYNIFHNGQINTIVKENAKVNIIIANILNQNADSIYALENQIEKNAELEYTIVDLGAKTTISNYSTELIGDGSKNYLNNIYLGKEKDVIDINYNMEICGKKSEAYINVQGAIKDYTKKNFKGTIDFKQGATKSIGKENENCMILSSTAKSKSLPMLLCHEEDVEGEHGIASGKIDESKLFYIMTKGISYEEARKLIIKANFSNILRKINNEELKNIINDEIDKI